MAMSFRTWSARAGDLEPNAEVDLYFDSSLLQHRGEDGFKRYHLSMLASEWEDQGRKLEALEEEANRTGAWVPVREFVRKMLRKYER